MTESPNSQLRQARYHERADELFDAHGVSYGELECSVLRGRVTDVYYNTSLECFVLEFTPGGFAKVSEEYAAGVASHFAHQTGRENAKLADLEGAWLEVGYSDRGSIWFFEVIRPDFGLRLYVRYLVCRRIAKNARRWLRAGAVYRCRPRRGRRSRIKEIRERLRRRVQTFPDIWRAS